MNRDLLNKCGDPNAPGTSVDVFLVCSCDIDTYPSFMTGTNPGDTITLDGNITLKSMKAFKKLQITTETGEVKDTMVGEIGSKSFESMIEGFVSKVDAPQLEWLKDTANSCPVAIIRDANGVMRVLGTKEKPAHLETGESATGKTSGDRRGIAFSIKSSQATPAPVYTGTIDLDATT